jgi:hypothetical protein
VGAPGKLRKLGVSGLVLPCRKTTGFARRLLWMQQLLEGVAHMHSQGWIHGDIKCDNILVKFGQIAANDRIKVRVHTGDERLLLASGPVASG